MEPANLDRLLALNSHLSALAEAEVPLALEREAAGDSSKGQKPDFEQFSSHVALQLSRGDSLEQALITSQQLPTGYRSAALGLLHGNGHLAALDTLGYQGATAREIKQSAFRFLASPLIVVTLAYGGLIYLCLSVSPSFEGIYQQLEQTPNYGVRLLAWLRSTLPVWGPLAPIVVLMGLWALKRGNLLNWLGWLPGVKNYMTLNQHAFFATKLSQLLENELPLPDALSLAGRQTHDKQIANAAFALSEARGSGGPIDPEQPELESLRPLLRWTLTDEPSQAHLTTNLRFVGDFYRRSASWRAGYLSYTAPIVGGVLVGGLIVMAYGLAVFSPVVGLLEDLSR